MSKNDSKQFEISKNEELSCVQDGGMFYTLYMGYRPPVSVENVYQTGSKLSRILDSYSIYP